MLNVIVEYQHHILCDVDFQYERCVLNIINDIQIWILILIYWEMIWIVFSENNEMFVSQAMGSIGFSHGLGQ